MSVRIDACGLSCPQPVLLFLTAVKQGDEKEFEVLVDNDASRENVSRAAMNNGCTVTCEDMGGGVSKICAVKA